MDNAQNAHQSVLNVILKICVLFVQKELLVIWFALMEKFMIIKAEVAWNSVLQKLLYQLYQSLDLELLSVCIAAMIVNHVLLKTEKPFANLVQMDSLLKMITVSKFVVMENSLRMEFAINVNQTAFHAAID